MVSGSIPGLTGDGTKGIGLMVNNTEKVDTPQAMVTLVEACGIKESVPDGLMMKSKSTKLEV